MNKQIKPWLDENGKPLSDQHLKLVSKYWSISDWEEYLQTQETGLKESLLEPEFYDLLAARQSETIFQRFVVTPDPASQKLVEGLLSILSPMQRTVLERIYVDGRSENYVANELNISRTTVQVHKQRALGRIKTHLAEVSSIFPYIGKSENCSKDVLQKIDEFYSQGTLTKDQRFFLWALVEVGGLNGRVL